MERKHFIAAPKELISWNDFRRKYELSEESLHYSGLDWDEYERIYQTHLQNRGAHKVFSQQVCDSLARLPELHSIRSRIKHPEHLVAKILRKNCEARNLLDESGPANSENEPRITFENFQDQVTDLVGVRVLTLLKTHRQAIHDGLIGAWKPLEKVCNYRRGDPQDAFAFLSQQGFLLKEHPDGYRSWHYLVEGFLGGRKCTAEIQLRTVFEEAWSEIDHELRYPDHPQDESLNGYLMMMNRLAGTADSIASMAYDLKQMVGKPAPRLIEFRDRRHRQIENQLRALGVDGVHRYCSKCGKALGCRSLIPTCDACRRLKTPESWNDVERNEQVNQIQR